MHVHAQTGRMCTQSWSPTSMCVSMPMCGPHLPAFTRTDMCLPSRPTPTPHTRTTCFSLVWVQGQCQAGCALCPSCARPPLGQWFLGSVWQGAPMCPQATSSCCSAPPSSGRYSQRSAPRSGSTWPASTPTSWSRCGGSPTLCPTSSTAGGSQGIASLRSPVGAGGSLGLRRRLVSRADRHTWALARTEPWTGAASDVLWPPWTPTSQQRGLLEFLWLEAAGGGGVTGP